MAECVIFAAAFRLGYHTSNASRNSTLKSPFHFITVSFIQDNSIFRREYLDGLLSGVGSRFISFLLQSLLHTHCLHMTGVQQIFVEWMNVPFLWSGGSSFSFSVFWNFFPASWSSYENLAFPRCCQPGRFASDLLSITSPCYQISCFPELVLFIYCWLSWWLSLIHVTTCQMWWNAF